MSLALIYTVMVVAQLFEFEKFVPLVESFWLPGGVVAASLAAALLVTTEVLAIPYLLNIPLSPAMRVLSATFAVGVAAAWLGLGVWLTVTTNAVDNFGILGTTVPVAVGWWSVAMGAVLLALALAAVFYRSGRAKNLAPTG